ncbi:hypothetical protein [Aeoliella sp. SH292]|uniref:hypothetical protein n=1 Tax=Aeoliella sp. SH292 TaxID=3454464 RepID=UPI003F981882
MVSVAARECLLQTIHGTFGAMNVLTIRNPAIARKSPYSKEGESERPTNEYSLWRYSS